MGPKNIGPGYPTVIGCRATQAGTRETCALLWAAVLDTPMSASSRSSSSRSCLYWCRRSHPSAIPASHASGIFQDHPRSGKEGEAASRVSVELQVVLPQGMFHLRNGAKQRLAAGAHRAVVKSPSDICIIPTFGAQAIAIEYQLTKSPRAAANGLTARAASSLFGSWGPSDLPTRRQAQVSRPFCFTRAQPCHPTPLYPRISFPV